MARFTPSPDIASNTTSPFAGAEGEVVLDAVSGEGVDFAIVHADWQGDGDHPFGPFGAFAKFLREIEDVGSEVKLLRGHGEDGVFEQMFHGDWGVFFFSEHGLRLAASV